MTLKTYPWDAAAMLKTETDRLQYLVACIEEAPDDAAFFAQALGDVARSRNMSQLARDSGLTREGLYRALSEMGNPSFDTVLRVVRALGYRLTIVADVPKAAASKRVAAKRSRAPATKTAGKAARKSSASKASRPLR